MQKLMSGAGIGAALGAVLAFFLDPRSGARRRNVTRDRTLAFFRRGARKVEQGGRFAAAEAYGVAQGAMHLREEPKDHNDATLAQKVESEVFQPAHIPKGQVNVNAQDGIVQLRGEVDRPELIEELVERTRSVQGVREVENLLHLPGTPAPMHH